MCLWKKIVDNIPNCLEAVLMATTYENPVTVATFKGISLHNFHATVSFSDFLVAKPCVIAPVLMTS